MAKDKKIITISVKKVQVVSGIESNHAFDQSRAVIIKTRRLKTVTLTAPSVDRGAKQHAPGVL